MENEFMFVNMGMVEFEESDAVDVERLEST